MRYSIKPTFRADKIGSDFLFVALSVNYSYLADGTKLTASDKDGNGFVYFGSLVYRREDARESFIEIASDGISPQGLEDFVVVRYYYNLESAPFDGGRLAVTQVAGANVYTPQYYTTDHLGSVRVIVDGNTGDVLERNDYYPFGLRTDKADYEIADNRYRYNGKEEQTFVGVPYADYGARMYDSKYRIAWNGVDPLAETQHSGSPFAFCANNPVNRVDPNGMRDDKYYNEKGEMIYDTGVGNRAFVIKTSNENITGGAPIDNIEAQETEQKISQGQLKGDHMQNIVEIVPLATLKAAKSTIKDDGTGSHPRKPYNQRETGGNILRDNSIANVTHGPMRGSNGKLNASVNIPQNPKTKATYHSHPSGTIMINGELHHSAPYPSLADYKGAGNNTNYLFYTRTGVILIYNNKNIIATLPFSALDR